MKATKVQIEEVLHCLQDYINFEDSSPSTTPEDVFVASPSSDHDETEHAYVEDHGRFQGPYLPTFHWLELRNDAMGSHQLHVAYDAVRNIDSEDRGTEGAWDRFKGYSRGKIKYDGPDEHLQRLWGRFSQEFIRQYVADVRLFCRECQGFVKRMKQMRSDERGRPQQVGEASRQRLDVRAFALFVANPSLTKKEIAKELGCNEKSLAPSRCPKLAQAIASWKAPDRIPSGKRRRPSNLDIRTDDDE